MVSVVCISSATGRKEDSRLEYCCHLWPVDFLRDKRGTKGIKTANNFSISASLGTNVSCSSLDMP